MIVALVAIEGCAAPASALDGDAERDASALDAPSERVEACMGVPVGYECVGDRLRLCDLGEPWQIDCAMPPGAGSPGRCARVGEEHACVVAAGGGCRLDVAHGAHAHVFWAHCEGERAGCVVRERGAGFTGTCVEDLGPCTVEDIHTCRGSQLVTRCVRGQPVTMDCAALGGSCAPNQCTGLPEGAPCGFNLACAAGLACTRASRSELFRCRVATDR